MPGSLSDGGDTEMSKPSLPYSQLGASNFKQRSPSEKTE